jgi:hypothetical protein
MEVMARRSEIRRIRLDSGGNGVAFRVVNELTHAGDPRAEEVGKRRPPVIGAAALRATGQLNHLAAALLRRPFKVKRGADRFSPHAEADAWMMNLQIH